MDLLLRSLLTAAVLTAVMATLSVLVLHACMHYRTSPIARTTIKSIFQDWLVFVPCWGVALGLRSVAHFNIIVCAWWGVLAFIIEIHLLEKYINSRWATTSSIRTPTPDELAGLAEQPDEAWQQILNDALLYLQSVQPAGLRAVVQARARLKKSSTRAELSGLHDDSLPVRFLNWCQDLLNAVFEDEFADRFDPNLLSVASIYAPQILNDAYGDKYDNDRRIVRSFAQAHGLEAIAHAFYTIWYAHIGRPRYISGPHE